MKLEEMQKQLLREVINEIIEKIDKRKENINNRELLKICENFDIFSNETNPHLCHEIAETALNLLINVKYAQGLLAEKNPMLMVRDFLKPLTLRLPTQTWRSQEQIKFQQFSTPPTIAYLLAYLLSLNGREDVLEPSAGTGNLAVWTSDNGIKTHTNEIDSRRRFLLEQIGFAPTSFNAEFINDFLPHEYAPDCVVMNPPFSSSGGRTKNNSSKFGFRHVESALERLKKGGKFGIILGEAGGLDSKTGNDFWRKHSDRIEVRSVIKINGLEYARYGTTVDINVIIGKKLLVPKRTDWNQKLNKIICFSANTVEEAFAKAETFNLSLNQ